LTGVEEKEGALADAKGDGRAREGEEQSARGGAQENDKGAPLESPKGDVTVANALRILAFERAARRGPRAKIRYGKAADREKRDTQMWLTLGPKGARFVREEARRRGVSVASYVGDMATRGTTYFGGPTVIRDELEEPLMYLQGFGYTLNELARALNAARLVASQDEVDLEELARHVARASNMCEQMQYGSEHALAIEALGGDDDVEWLREGPSIYERTPDDAPSDGVIHVRLSELEAWTIRSTAEDLSLTPGHWVVVSCTPLCPKFRPFDRGFGLDISLELVRQRTNLTQAMSALRFVSEVAPSEYAPFDDWIMGTLEGRLVEIDRCQEIIMARVAFSSAVV
jgi:hypothetical protein